MARPKIFVSHSTLDTPFAAKLVNDLNAAGAQAWMDSNDLGPGNFQQRISEALADCEWFLLVLTRNALASEWVRQEVDAANRLKHQKRVKDLIFIKAAALDLSELPALWGVFNVFDATADYTSALSRTKKAVGLVAQTAAGAQVSKGIRLSVQDTESDPFDWSSIKISRPCPRCGHFNNDLLVTCEKCGKTLRNASGS